MSAPIYTNLETYTYDDGALKSLNPIEESEAMERVNETIANLQGLLRDAKAFRQALNDGTLSTGESVTLVLNNGKDSGYDISALGLSEDT